MAHVFVSYSHDDYGFISELAEQCKQANIETWIDDHSLIGGDDWKAAIDVAIMNAYAVLVVITPAGSFSPYVTYEWSFALGQSKRVIPLILQPVELHPALSRTQWVDFTQDGDCWNKLFTALGKAKADYESQLTSVPVPPNAPPAVRNAIQLLDSASSKDRKEAIRTLKEQQRHPAAVEALASALRVVTESIRLDSTLALLEIGTSAAFEKLVDVKPIKELCDLVTQKWSNLPDATKLIVLDVMKEIAAPEFYTVLDRILPSKAGQTFYGSGFNECLLTLEAIGTDEAVARIATLTVYYYNDQVRDALVRIGSRAVPFLAERLLEFPEQQYGTGPERDRIKSILETINTINAHLAIVKSCRRESYEQFVAVTKLIEILETPEAQAALSNAGLN